MLSEQRDERRNPAAPTQADGRYADVDQARVASAQQPSSDTVRIKPPLNRLVEEATALSAGRDSIIKGNHDELESAFANFLSNTVSYTRDGCHIAVS